MRNSMNLSHKIAYSGIVMALYIAIVFLTQSFAFGQYQIRIATGLYALTVHFTFLIVPLALANMMSNLLMGGFGIFDILGGFLVGLITSAGVALLGRQTKSAWISVLPIAIAPATIVPIWLSYLLNLPYISLVFSLLIGQIISAYTLGLFIAKSKWMSTLIH